MKKEIAVRLAATLQSAGYSALFAGGCVRDQLLGRAPKDYDIATSAMPDQVIQVFQDHTIVEIGKPFGIIMVVVEGEKYEIATFRCDGQYLDGRRPEGVKLIQDVCADAERRDFTVNGMYIDPVSGAIVDPVGGEADLKLGLIRAIGNPEERFSEDYLRMLRAPRFAAQLGFKIDHSTAFAIQRNAGKITKISAERVRDEIVKTLAAETPSVGFRAMRDLGLLQYVLPELQKLVGLPGGKYHSEDGFDHTMSVLDRTPNEPLLRLAALLHDIGKADTIKPHPEKGFEFIDHQVVGAAQAVEVLQRLHFDNKTIEVVKLLVEEHMALRSARRGELTDKALRRFARKCGTPEMLAMALDLGEADWMAHPDADSDVYVEIRERYKAMADEKPEKKQSLVTGKDIMDLGISPGPLVGQLLKRVQELLDLDPTLSKEKVLGMLRNAPYA